MTASRSMRPTDIAESYKLSIKTVSTYRTRIFEKLSVSSNAELTMYCIRHNLISND